MTRGTLLAIGALTLALTASALGCDRQKPAAPAAVTPRSQATTATPTLGGVVEVRLSEWSVRPTPAQVPAGTITFQVSNIGLSPHDFIVIRTDIDPDNLPTRQDGSVDLGAGGLDVTGQIEPFSGGLERSLTVRLEAGAYALICNIVESDGTSHYQRGMLAGFTVAE